MNDNSNNMDEMWEPIANSAESRKLQLSLADLFSDAVECFGMIHGKKKSWDWPQELILTRLGIQQARLLAWGDIVGICSLNQGRDSSLDEPDTRSKVEDILKSIVALYKPADEKSYQIIYGLKHTKKSINDLEPALDFARMEAFRERFALLSLTSHSPRITGSHWILHDNSRMDGFIHKVRTLVDSLISLFDLEERVSLAVKLDIHALGWHPVFERTKAASDGHKLQLIKQVCKDTYPSFVAATEKALAYLNKEWNDDYQEAVARTEHHMQSALPSRSSSADAVKRAREEAKRAEALAMNQSFATQRAREVAHIPSPMPSPKPSPKPSKRSSIFGSLRGWRRGSKQEDPVRALSSSFVESQRKELEKEDMEELAPARSRSMVVMPTKMPDPEAELQDPEAGGLGPVESMASRHDYGRRSIG
jgi:HET-S-like prion-inhibition and propagation protein